MDVEYRETEWMKGTAKRRRLAGYSSGVERSIVPIEIISRQYLCQSWAPFIGSALTSSPHLEQRTPFLLISTPSALVIKRAQSNAIRETQQRVARRGTSNFEDARTLSLQPLYSRDGIKITETITARRDSAHRSTLVSSSPFLLSTTLEVTLVPALQSRQTTERRERARNERAKFPFNRPFFQPPRILVVPRRTEHREREREERESRWNFHVFSRNNGNNVNRRTTAAVFNPLFSTNFLYIVRQLLLFSNLFTKHRRLKWYSIGNNYLNGIWHEIFSIISFQRAISFKFKATSALRVYYNSIIYTRVNNRCNLCKNNIPRYFLNFRNVNWLERLFSKVSSPEILLFFLRRYYSFHSVQILYYYIIL